MEQQRLSKRMLVMAGCLLMALATYAQDSSRHVFSIKQAVDYAHQHNVQIKNSLLDVALQQQQNREITAAAFPQLNGSVSGTYNPNIAVQVIPDFIAPSTYKVLTDAGVNDGSGNPIVAPSSYGVIAAQFGTKFNALAGIDLNQILFDGQVFVGLQARATSLLWRKKNSEVTEEMIKTNIYKVYYQLVVSKTQIQLLDANIERLNKLLNDTREIYKNGFAEKLDVDRVLVQLANLETEKAKALNSISNGYYGLKVLMGMPVAHELILTDSLSEEEIKSGVLNTGEYAYEDRKEYQFAGLGRKLNEFNVKRYQLSQIPTVSLAGNYSKSAQRSKFDFFGKGQWFTVSSINLRISVPIFNGFAAKARIQQARIELMKSDNEIESLKLSIDNEVAVARNDLKTAIGTMDYQKKNLELATTVYDQTKKKYEIGTGSQTEINTAQTDLKTAQTNYINALYDAIIAKVDFQKATGKL